MEMTQTGLFFTHNFFSVDDVNKQNLTNVSFCDNNDNKINTKSNQNLRHSVCTPTPWAAILSKMLLYLQESHSVDILGASFWQIPTPLSYGSYLYETSKKS